MEIFKNFAPIKTEVKTQTNWRSFFGKKTSFCFDATVKCLLTRRCSVLFSFQLISLFFCKLSSSIIVSKTEHHFHLFSVTAQSSGTNICSSTATETKNDTCPNGATFDIMAEYEKAATTWRIDFNVSCLLYMKNKIRNEFVGFTECIRFKRC